MLNVLKNPQFHIFLRALAALVIGPVLLVYGDRHKLIGLTILGAGTMLVDGYTLLKSLHALTDNDRQ